MRRAKTKIPTPTPMAVMKSVRSWIARAPGVAGGGRRFGVRRRAISRTIAPRMNVTTATFGHEDTRRRKSDPLNTFPADPARARSPYGGGAGEDRERTRLKSRHR